jgi:hypothetical protein
LPEALASSKFGFHIGWKNLNAMLYLNINSNRQLCIVEMNSSFIDAWRGVVRQLDLQQRGVRPRIFYWSNSDAGRHYTRQVDGASRGSGGMIR